jgi:hypothetical protein
MNDPVSWRAHVYQMSDAASHDAVTELLGRVEDITMECAGPLHCLTVTCRNLNQARRVHRLVTLSDPMAVLVNTTYGLSAPQLNPIQVSL